MVMSATEYSAHMQILETCICILALEAVGLGWARRGREGGRLYTHVVEYKHTYKHINIYIFIYMEIRM